MSSFKTPREMFPLNSEVSVYVPGTIDRNNIIDTTDYSMSIARKFTEMFGGATITIGTGIYKSQKSDEFIEEKIIIVSANCTTKMLLDYLPEIYDLCHNLKEDLKQECIALKVNGQMGFIGSEYNPK